MHALLVVSAVSLYWLSYIGVGLAAWIWLRVMRYRPANTFARFVSSAPLPAQLLLFFAVGCGAFVPGLVLGFAVSAPLAALALYYVALLVLAAWTIGHFRTQVCAYATETRRRFAATPRFCWGMFILSGIVIAAVGVMFGAFVADGTDSYVHMARIAQIAHGHLTISDPYFPGVIESRYHVNILYGLYSVVVKLTGISTLDIWRYSYAAFLLLAYLSLFTVAWYFLPRKQRTVWPYIVSGLSVGLALMFWRTADYPNEVVLVWIALYIIGLIRFAKGRDMALMMLGAILTALTQPTYSLMAVAFTALFGVMVVLFARDRVRALTGRQLLAIGLTLAILTAAVIPSLVFPNRMSDTYFGFGANDPSLQFMHVGALQVMHLPGITLISATLAALSLVGYVWLWRRADSRMARIAIASLAIFYAVLAYNPLFVKVVQKEMPPWMIQRFTYFNRLGAVAAAIGLFVVLTTTLRLFASNKRQLIGVTLLAIVLLAPVYDTAARQVAATAPLTGHELPLARSLPPLRAELQGQVVYATIGISFILPGMVPDAHAVWMPATNTSPVADMQKRTACGQALQKDLSLSDLRAAGVTRVLAGNWKGDIYELAATKPYLHRIALNTTYTVYEVNYPANMQPDPHSVCTIPYGS